MRTTLTADVVEFRAKRSAAMVNLENELLDIVDEALRAYSRGDFDWSDEPIEAAAVLWWETFEVEQGRAPTPLELADFQSTLAAVLARTGEPTDPPEDRQVELISGWLSAYALNAATAAGGGRLEWVTRHDADVRDIHRPLDGEVNSAGAFDVAGYALRFPGDPVGPPHVWINCRCVVRRVEDDEMTTTTASGATLSNDPVTAATPVMGPGDDDPGENDSGDDVDDDEGFYDEQGDYADLDSEVPWHGVIAPTGVVSGDSRKFLADVLRHRELPLPVKFQRADDEGHKGSVVVANMTHVEEVDGLIRAEGTFHDSADADQAIDLIANRMLRGLSVDLDDAAFELQYPDGSPYDMEDSDTLPIAVVTDGRIASVTLCAIPAFQEAYIALGTWADAEDLEAVTAGCLPCQAREMDALYESWASFAVVDTEWDGSAGRFDNDQWFRSTILHRSDDPAVKGDHSLPILEPNGDLNRNAVHAAAARINQVEGATPEQLASAKRALIAAYRKLDEEPPEVLVAAAFASPPGTHDGPGWLTNPRETQRLRTYWTRGKGAAKIRWGQPGDFNRCRRQLAKYVPNPQYLAGTCANLHRVALGLWPGQETGKHALHVEGSSDLPGQLRDALHKNLLAASPAFGFADVDEQDAPPREWFIDPELGGLTPLTIEGRRVYGHLAGWATCHTGFGVSVGDGEVCVQPPHSSTGYAYFHTGSVLTDDGLVAVGHITMDTGHAGMNLPARPAAAHYDNTGAVVADVRVGEDEHGIWFAGALRSQISDAQRIALQAASLSGDWRVFGGAYDLVAALAVNVPGFPIPRTAVAASATGPTALVAAGLVVLDPEPTLRDQVRAELALVRAEEARLIKRAEVVARVHAMQAERARARLNAVR